MPQMVLLILHWCLRHANDHRPLLDTGRCNPVIDDGGTEGIANISFSQNRWNSFVFYLGFRTERFCNGITANMVINKSNLRKKGRQSQGSMGQFQFVREVLIAL